MVKVRESLVGRQFGRLTVVEQVEDYVTPSQNQMNSKLSSNNTSGVTGVYWVKKCNKWNANIKINNKYIHLGNFTDFDDAVKARKEAEQKYFGEYSYSNSQMFKEEINK